MRVVYFLIVSFFFFGANQLIGQKGVDFCNLSSKNGTIDYCQKTDEFIQIYIANINKGENGKEQCYKGMVTGLKKLNGLFSSGRLLGKDLIETKKIAKDLEKEICFKARELKQILSQTIIIVEKNIVSCDPGQPGLDCDGDGIVNEHDCEPKNPKVLGWKSACDDKNPDTENDKYDKNCNCKGEKLTPKGKVEESVKDEGGKSKKEPTTRKTTTGKNKTKKTEKKDPSKLKLERKDLLWLLFIPLFLALFRISKLTKKLKKSSNASSSLPPDYQDNMKRLKELEIINASSLNKNNDLEKIQQLESRISEYERENHRLKKRNESLELDSEELNKIYAKQGLIQEPVLETPKKVQSQYVVSGFFSSPNKDGEKFFKQSDLSTTVKQGSYYEFMKISETHGEFRLLRNQTVHQKAIKSYDYILAPACDSVNGFNPSAKGIEHVENGKLSLINGNWKIMQNCKIKFL